VVYNEVCYQYVARPTIIIEDISVLPVGTKRGVIPPPDLFKCALENLLLAYLLTYLFIYLPIVFKATFH